MVNFGPLDSVPEKFRNRQLHRHNASITLMRTTVEENAELGRIIGRKLNQSLGPVTLFVPKCGVSMIDVEGQPFFDPEADNALFDALLDGLNSNIRVQTHETHINDPAFATAMAEELDRLYRAWSANRGEAPVEGRELTNGNSAKRDFAATPHTD